MPVIFLVLLAFAIPALLIWLASLAIAAAIVFGGLALCLLIAAGALGFAWRAGEKHFNKPQHWIIAFIVTWVLFLCLWAWLGVGFEINTPENIFALHGVLPLVSAATLFVAGYGAAKDFFPRPPPPLRDYSFIDTTNPENIYIFHDTAGLGLLRTGTGVTYSIEFRSGRSLLRKSDQWRIITANEAKRIIELASQSTASDERALRLSSYNAR